MYVTKQENTDMQPERDRLEISEVMIEAGVEMYDAMHCGRQATPFSAMASRAIVKEIYRAMAIASLSCPDRAET